MDARLREALEGELGARIRSASVVHGGDVAAAFRVGHALGNRHAPVALRAGGLTTPVSETPELAARPVLALGLAGVSVRFVEGPFAPDAPPDCAGMAHD